MKTTPLLRLNPINNAFKTHKMLIIGLCVSLLTLSTGDLRAACTDDPCTTALTVERYTVIGPTTLKSEQGWLHCDGTYQVITSTVETWSESFVSEYLPISGRKVCQLLYYNGYKGAGCLKNWVRSDRVYGTAPFELVIVAISGKEDPNGLLLNLSVSAGGGGTVNGGAIYKPGTPLTITATPKPGYLFASWTENGAMVSTSASYTLTLNDNRSLVANFIPNPFPPAKGSYAGLFSDPSDATYHSSGFVTATTTDKGGFSAKLQLAGKSYSLSGQFSAFGSFSNSIPRNGLSPLIVVLRLDLNGGDTLAGSIGDGVWTAEVVAHRATFNATTSPCTQAGKYTLIIPGSENSATEPGGDGFGAVTIASSGGIQFSGTLGDGSKVTQKTFLSKHGQWPLYLSLYSGRGSLVGWLTFTNKSGGDLEGLVSWSKPGQTGVGLYPGGFNVRAEAVGSRYAQPAAGTRILGFSEGRVILENGGLSQSITNFTTIDPHNNATSPGSKNFKMKFTLASGLFQGSVTDPATMKPVPFKGAVLQNMSIGSGFFLGANQTGRVFIGP